MRGCIFDEDGVTDPRECRCEHCFCQRADSCAADAYHIANCCQCRCARFVVSVNRRWAIGPCRLSEVAS